MRGANPPIVIWYRRRPVVVRVVWVVTVGLALALFIASLPAMYRQLSAPPVAMRAALRSLGLSLAFYATYLTALQAIFAIGCFVVPALMVRRKPDDGMVLFVALTLVLLGAINVSSASALEMLHPAMVLPVEVFLYLSVATVMLLICVFPDGRFIPQWSYVFMLAWLAGLPITVLSTRDRLAQPQSVWFWVMLFSGFAAAVGFQAYRFLRVSNRVQRQQTKWVLFGVAGALVGQLVFPVLASFFPALVPAGLQATPYDLISGTGLTVTYLLIPLTIGIAISRYRLWDIDVLINRTLVYMVLTATTLGIYVLVVGGLSILLQARGKPLVAVLATGLVAVLFQPLRGRVQYGVNRLMYGERDDPYTVLSRLGQQLDGMLAPEAALTAVAQAVTDALRLPYAAIALYQGEQVTVAAAAGLPVVEPLRLPLLHQQATVGELLVGARAPGEDFNPADRRLLGDLARQAGAAAHALRLTADLQRSRERLVTAREEERRRLRRDLHDGLGPALASMVMQSETARDLLTSAPDRSAAVLAELTEQLQLATSDIRRLVYALRPPALDELGLVSATQAHVARYDLGTLRIAVDAPECMPPLSAAVEVAAYRIIQEALTNVVRHAEARTCSIRFALDEAAARLTLEIRDDGHGLPSERGTGVGLTSMRERAEELGGFCRVEALATGGTRVCAALPLLSDSG